MEIRVAGRGFERTDTTPDRSCRGYDFGVGWNLAVARATGVSQRAIRQGIKELKAEEVLDQGRIRRPGGGRKKTVSKDVSLWKDLERLVEKDVSLWKELERLVEPLTRRGLISPLWWPSKSVRKLAAELEELGHQVSHQLVSELLHDMSFSLQVSRKLHEYGDDLDRYDQFSNLNPMAEVFSTADEPIVSVDTMREDLSHVFPHGGFVWHP